MTPLEDSGMGGPPLPQFKPPTAPPPPNIPVAPAAKASPLPPPWTPASPASPVGGPVGGPPSSPAAPPRPVFPSASPAKPFDPLRPAPPAGGPPFTPSKPGALSSMPGGIAATPAYHSQSNIRKVLMVIIFVALLIVAALVVLFIVGSNNDRRVDQQVNNQPGTGSELVPRQPASSAPSPVSGAVPAAGLSDAERVAAIDSVSQAIERYYRDHRADPVVTSDIAQNRWANLMGILVQSGYLVDPVVDPAGEARFDYRSEALGRGFVLGATLTNSLDSHLAAGLHGAPYGMSCEAPVYCKGFVK